MSINIYTITKPDSNELFYSRTFSVNGKVINKKTYEYDDNDTLISTPRETFDSKRKNLKGLAYKKLYTINTRTAQGKELIKLIFEGKINDIDNKLLDFGINQWYINNKQIFFDITTNNDKIFLDSTTPSKTTRSIKKSKIIDGEIVENKYKTYYKNKEDFLKQYKILDGMNSLTIPYINYDDNKTNDSKCVYHYLTKNYLNQTKNRQIKKDIEDFNKLGGTYPQEIINLCNKHNIKCVLYNITGEMVFNNEKPSHNDLLDFVAILANNHLYPKLKTSKIHKPLLNTENKLEEEPKEKEINIQLNNKLYFKNGYVDLSVEEDKEESNYNKTFMSNLFPNFTYKTLNQCLTVRSLLYMDKDIENYNSEDIFAFDVNKAYYQVAKTTKGDEFCPVYTVQDIPQKYKKEEIENYYLYFIKESTLKKLKCVGITSNNIYGDILKLLIKNKLVKKTDIEYFLKCSYKLEWQIFKDRINKNEKEGSMRSTFKFYNGMLGSTSKTTLKSYNNILLEDEFLIQSLTNNNSYSAVIIEDKQFGSFDYCQTTFKHINNKNIYNFIVNKTNLMVLTQLFKIKKAHPEVKLLKIRTDSLTFDKPVDEKLFKLDNKKGSFKGWKNETNPKIKFSGVNLTYYNIKEILEDVKQEIKNFSKNVKVIQGAPGVGKTHYIKNNETFDYGLTTTNLCLFNMTNDELDTTKYKTIYSFLGLGSPEDLLSKIKKYKNKTIWIDEFSMINLFIYNYIFMLGTINNNKFIISGDINQIEPVGESKIDLNNLFFSEMFKNKQTLTKNYRNDKEIIELRENVLSNTIEKNKKIFNKLSSTKDFKNFDIHIVATNNYKNGINKEIMKDRKLEFNKDKISKNLILQVSQTNKKLNLFKNDRFKVIDSTDNISLYNLRNKETITLNKDIVLKYFEAGYAITCHSSQGLTITEDFCIHQTKKMIEWNKEILYTAITRAKNYNQLNLYFEPVINGFKTDKKDDKFNKFDSVIYDY